MLLATWLPGDVVEVLYHVSKWAKAKVESIKDRGPEAEPGYGLLILNGDGGRRVVSTRLGPDGEPRMRSVEPAEAVESGEGGAPAPADETDRAREIPANRSGAMAGEPL